MTQKAKPTKPGNGKDVIYVDADEEITGIIDKVQGSNQKIVALVLPKRAAVLQSIVNMKLLKRTADSAKKHIVLITSEAGLLPLAGNVGLHVAHSLQSKPEIPDAPIKADDKPEAIDEEGEEDTAEEDLDKTKTIGELAGGAMAASDLDDTIELDNDDDPAEDDETAAADAPAKAKNKKFKIPNFNKFRMLLVFGAIGIIGLGVLLYVCLAVLPAASLTIKTDSTAVSTNPALTLKTGDNVLLDAKTNTVPAQKQEVKKTLSQQVNASGQQNNGTKATGTIKFYNCNKDDTLSGTTRTILAGTGVNANGLTFVTNENVVVSPSHFAGGTCKQDVPSATIGMTSQLAGTRYNQDPAGYVVAGYPTIAGYGSATTGGTDNIIKIVTQADIDSASQKIGAQDTTGVKQELKTDLTNNKLYPVEPSFNPGAPETKTSVNAGDTADNVTVTQTITYSMLGVKQSDLQKIIAASVTQKIDPSKQAILDYGLDTATFLLQEQKPDGATVALQTTVVAGPDLNVDSIKKQVAGKKSGDAQQLIKAFPGVTDVSVHYSPFWVGAIPSKTSKITVTVEKPQAPVKANDTDATSH